jgi:hypothetical protein
MPPSTTSRRASELLVEKPPLTTIARVSPSRLKYQVFRTV